jgi:hypothetical protein
VTAPFWMIARAPRHEHSRTEPKVRYPTEAAAAEAAQRLADDTGADVVILAVTATVTPRSDTYTLF